MRTNLYPLLLTAVTLGLTACTDDFAETPDVAPMPEGYYFLLADSGTRVSYDTDTGATFDEGDELGVFALASYDEGSQNWTAAAGEKQNARYRVKRIPSVNADSDGRQALVPATDAETLTEGCYAYLFYYPYDPAVGSLADIRTYAFAVQANQRDGDGYAASDLLWSVTFSDPAKNYLEIAMDHVMANIVLEIDETKLDVEAGATVPQMPLLAEGIDLGATEWRSLGYAAGGDTSDIPMQEAGYTSSGAIRFRALVPALRTLKEGTPIIRIEQEGAEKTFQLQSDLELRPGRIYTFLLKRDVDHIPDLTDDDSWVLDVEDPETGETVGLLCREYIRFQPDAEDYDTVDQITGSAATNPDGSASCNLSSQAWVFYPLLPGSNVPNLDEGTVLRFLYDLRWSISGTDDMGAHSWPLPHHYGDNMGFTAQGLFLPEHGHDWVYSEDGTYGMSSTAGEEYYLHGGKITWEAETVTDEELGDELTFYKIKSFKKPEMPITNAIAEKNGHIAIKPDGTAEVSYYPFNPDTHIDEQKYKVGQVEQHYLIDTRTNTDGHVRTVKYPLVKIGYNNFWMSSALRAHTLTDGTPLECYNQEEDPWTTFDAYGSGVLDPGFLYPRSKEYDFDFFTYENFDPDTAPHLYNYTAVASGKLCPISPDNRFTYMMPTRNNQRRLAHYVGWKYAAKMMTSAIRTRNETGYDEDLATAIALGKIVDPTCNSFTANISGLNMKTAGMYFGNGNQFINLGETSIYWLDNAYMMKFKPFDTFNVTTTSIFSDDLVEGYNAQPEIRSRVFAGIRFLAKMTHQLDTGRGTSARKAGTEPNAEPQENRTVYILLE